MAQMNLAIRGIEADLGQYNADTFFHDCHPTLKADFVLANPPFNLSDWGADKLADDVRWKYGTPPNGNANFAWIQHIIHHLAPTGRAGVVLANGSLSSQSGGEGDIRRRLVEADLVDCIVAMPPQLFYTTQIPVSIWFFNKAKTQPGHTLFIDARNLGTMVTRKLRELTDCESEDPARRGDIQRIADTYWAYAEGHLEAEQGFCAVATTGEIAAQEFILTPGRYVGIAAQAEDSEPFAAKMERLTGELSDLFAQSHDLEAEIRRQLASIGYKMKSIMTDLLNKLQEACQKANLLEIESLVREIEQKVPGTYEKAQVQTCHNLNSIGKLNEVVLKEIMKPIDEIRGQYLIEIAITILSILSEKNNDQNE